MLQAFTLILMMALLPAPASANLKASSWTEVDDTYFNKIGHKLGFGIQNILTGWSAIFFEPYYEPNKLIGLIKGIGYTLTNTAGGLIHAATFPIPLDVPLPEGGIAYEYSR